MSRAVRPRPVDVYKPLQIHYGFVDDKELRYEDENGFMRTVVQGDNGAQEVSVSVLSLSWQICSHAKTIHQPKPEEIVIQCASIVEDYETMAHEKYKPGNAYIKQSDSDTLREEECLFSHLIVFDREDCWRPGGICLWRWRYGMDRQM